MPGSRRRVPAGEGGGVIVAANLICLANKIVLGPFLKYADDYWPRQANNRNIKKFFDFYFTESRRTSTSFLYIHVYKKYLGKLGLTLFRQMKIGHGS